MKKARKRAPSDYIKGSKKYSKAWIKFNKKWKEGPGGCHLWQGLLDRDGYGSFRLKPYFYRAHRAIWWFHHEDLPKGLVINHMCRTRNCVNIDHLEMVTPEMNMILDSNHWINRTHCVKGHPFDGTKGMGSKRDRARTCSICRTESRRSRRAKRKALGLPYQ